MKKAIWIIAVLGLVLAAVALSFLPETVPVHFDAAWNPDRWGSRWELLILPAALLLLAGIFTVVMNVWGKESEEAEEDKARAGALTNRKAIGIAGISTLSMLLLVFAWLMLRIFRAASGGEPSGDALDRLPFMLMGILTVIAAAALPGFLAPLAAMAALLTAAVIGTLFYARRVYLRERERTKEK